ncbi:uncharacterized protein HD556DRAFT_1318506 [Suillus plorans]|uniref:Copper transport protein n=1 Tax=Suillus plorans TaxID=116603 RepID=A0A9P7E3X8_9AGAM|nr:uncharacterized protein HD556DRAFT_1318506 [Suillus plorans]KAG1810173.1 hypothetical protein HD556DRAFT_1318506 [Suillus plorans]
MHNRRTALSPTTTFLLYTGSHDIMMDGWVDYVHFSFIGEHILLSSLRLNTVWEFFLGVLLTSVICLSERFLSFAISRHWGPHFIGRSRLAKAVWRTVLYGVATTLRLTYMLIAMSYQVGLILAVVVMLSVGQFFLEYVDAAPGKSATYDKLRDLPLDSESEDDSYNMSTRSWQPRTRRMKSKPEAILIHPGDSNLARADAAAQELGIAGDTERVKANRYPVDQDAWEYGKGRDVARQLLGSTARRPRSPQDHPMPHISDGC